MCELQPDIICKQADIPPHNIIYAFANWDHTEKFYFRSLG